MKNCKKLKKKIRGNIQIEQNEPAGPKKRGQKSFTRFWVIASRVSFSLREISTKRFPTTERGIVVMSESTCKKYKNTFTHKITYLHNFEDLMRRLKISQGLT